MEDSKDNCSVEKVKKDWYQTDSYVVLTLFIKNVIEEEVQIDFEERKINVVVPQQSKLDYVTEFRLHQFVIPSESSYKIFSTKIEIKLKKKLLLRWDTLEGSDDIGNIRKYHPESVSHPPFAIARPSYPSSSTKKRDWNRIEAQVKLDEETEKPDGDAALNQLFQKIYSDGNEEVKRAMNKSFMESGGTVLSTNWKDVREKNVDVKAPDGMEWKAWEH